MKRFLLILTLFFAASLSLFAQDQDDDDDGNEKIRDKMREYIQQRLNLSDDETKKFTPVFIQYFKEWRQTLRDNKGPDKRLDRQQKIADLQVKYRGQFQQIVGERRANRVFDHQRQFLQELQQLRRERLRNSPARRGG